MQIIKGRTVEHSDVSVAGRSVNAAQLERWLGRDEVERISFAMRDWYGPPIAVAGVPGAVYAHRGGDFRGALRAGYEASARDLIYDKLARLKRAWRLAPKRNQLVMGAGFAGLSDWVSESEHGKETTLPFNKTNNVSPLSRRCVDLWRAGTLPVAAGAAPAAPGGEAPTNSTTGAFFFNNPISGDTQHFIGAYLKSSAVSSTALLYDRLFHVQKTMNSTATEAVTGVPTRYQSTTQGAQDSAEGNFLFVACDGTLPATAHNWTVCLYEDQSGNVGATLPSLTGNASAGQEDFDMPLGYWFAPLAAGDSGIKDLEQMQCSAAVVSASGVHFAIGHPIAWMPVPLVNVPYNPFQRQFAKLTRVFDNACLAFIQLPNANTSTTFSGTLTTVSG